MLTGGTIGSSEKFPSISAFNSSYFLKFEEVDYHILPILGLKRKPEGGAALVSIIPLVPLIAHDGEEVLLILVPLISL